jgi:RNA recognition motif-containing protein
VERNATVMNTKIYFDNLPAAVTEKELMELFSAHGNVVDVHIAMDRSYGEPCGFGFVTMVTPEGARAAIQFLEGKILGAGRLTLSEISPNKEPASSMNDPSSPRRRSSYLAKHL